MGKKKKIHKDYSTTQQYLMPIFIFFNFLFNSKCFNLYQSPSHCDLPMFVRRGCSFLNEPLYFWCQCHQCTLGLGHTEI